MNRQDLPYDAMVDGANKLPESKKCKCGGTLVAFGEALMQSLKCNQCNEFIAGVGEEFIDSIYEKYDQGERGWIEFTAKVEVIDEVKFLVLYGPRGKKFVYQVLENDNELCVKMAMQRACAIAQAIFKLGVGVASTAAR